MNLSTLLWIPRKGWSKSERFAAGVRDSSKYKEFQFIPKPLYWPNALLQNQRVAKNVAESTLVKSISKLSRICQRQEAPRRYFCRWYWTNGIGVFQGQNGLKNRWNEISQIFKGKTFNGAYMAYPRNWSDEHEQSLRSAMQPVYPSTKLTMNFNRVINKLMQQLLWKLKRCLLKLPDYYAGITTDS
jgi:hypothetical protein